jgi:hypothetical protein
MIMKRFLAAAVACMAVSACVSVPRTTAHFPTVPEIELMRQGLKSRLVDPESAEIGQFRASTTIEGDRVVYICGWVNARNRMGGFNGFMPFQGVIEQGRFRVTGVAATLSEAEILAMTCRMVGATLPSR